MDVLERAEFEVKTFGNPSKESGIKLIAEVARLRQLLSEAEKCEREARSKALEAAAQIAEKTGTDSENDWPGETWIASRIASAIRALQSEER